MKRGAPPKREEVTWSAKVAYAVGLMTTDGCLQSDGRHLDLTSKDKQQLVNFMRCIGKTVRIGKKKTTTGRQVSCIQFSDVVLFRFLLSIGLTPRKTHTLGPVEVPDLYFFDFLRGHFDGDGSFYSYYDPRWKESFMFYLSFVSASHAHISWLQQSIKKRLGVNGYLTKAKGQSVIQLRYAKREALIIIKKIYSKKASICLSRKRLKIQKALRIVGLSLFDK